MSEEMKIDDMTQGNVKEETMADYEDHLTMRIHGTV